MSGYVERFFGTLDEAMKARGVGEFVVAIRLRTVNIYVLTDSALPVLQCEVQVLSRPIGTEVKRANG